MTLAYVGLGANLCDREAAILMAAELTLCVAYLAVSWMLRFARFGLGGAAQLRRAHSPSRR